MITKRFCIIFGLFFPLSGFSFVNLQNTVSTGYYRDVEQESHFPTYFYSDFYHTGWKGIETSFNVGVNNNLVQDSWNLFLYHALVTVPLGEKSRVETGRQLFADGFDISLLDGIRLPLHWSSRGNVTFVGGLLRSVEQHRWDWDPKVYGVSLQENILGSIVKGGYLYTLNNNDRFHLGHGAFTKTWEHLLFNPTLTLRGQWNLEGLSADQYVAEIQLSPIESILIQTGYSLKDRQFLFPDIATEMFNLFARSPQKMWSWGMAWYAWPEVKIEGTWNETKFRSSGGPEAAQQQLLSLSLSYPILFAQCYVGHWDSFGGKILHGGGVLKKTLGEWVWFRAEGDVARLQKINGISNFAYHGRSGFDFRLKSNFLISTLAEVERNHYFDIDARAIVYVKHYIY